MDADRGPGNGAGMEATPDGGDTPARDAVHKARGLIGGNVDRAVADQRVGLQALPRAAR
jgi:hypothetical protein